LPEHPFHLKIGKLVNRLGLSLAEIRKDPACENDSPGVVTLLHNDDSGAVRFCQVDILITLPDKVVIVEIEESNVKPVHIFGKFFASASSTHSGTKEISKLPLLFIQVLDTSKLNLKEGKKGGQWDRIQGILISHAEKWPGRKVQYKMFRGGPADFEAGGNEGEKLLDLVRAFLKGRTV
jgi:hypothetical protein